MEQISYCLGFIFSHDLSTVYLIRKDHPQWQAGLLNGVGGKVEPDEYARDAMRREALEESGYSTEVWHIFGNIHCEYWFCELFASVMQAGQEPPRTTEAEPIVEVKVEDVFKRQTEMISNLPWLIFAALDNIKNPDNRFMLDVEYMA